MLLSPAAIRIPLTVVTVVVALGVAGALGARLSGAAPLKPTVRTVAGGGLALLLTFLTGRQFRSAGVA